MKIIWFSRHRPIARQLSELARLFPGHELYLDSETFRDADEIAQRFASADGDEMVIVAPLSVAQALLDRGLKPLWPEMQKVDRQQAEVTMRRADGRVDYYRFIRFRRLVAIELRFEEL